MCTFQKRTSNALKGKTKILWLYSQLLNVDSFFVNNLITHFFIAFPVVFFSSTFFLFDRTIHLSIDLARFPFRICEFQKIQLHYHDKIKINTSMNCVKVNLWKSFNLKIGIASICHLLCYCIFALYCVVFHRA